jgi:mannose-1-phosphate guanylyltransferase/mannose-6-phosphate isomerase
VRVYPVILCGGSGTRLWPVSRPDSPKQFIPLVGECSSFQETVKRVVGVDGAREPIIVANVRHGRVCQEQLDALGVKATLLLEPEGRDSSAAIAAAAAWIIDRDADGLAIIVSADHDIPNPAAFQEVAARALAAAELGWIVTIGMSPTQPSTAFGYIRPAAGVLAGLTAHAVESFVEKPDAATAAAYIADGYLWNSGNFIASAATLLAELDRHAPAVTAAARQAVSGLIQERPGVFNLGPAFATAPKISIDYAVMEKTDWAAVEAATFTWSDLGAWDAVKAAAPTDLQGNNLVGEAVLIDTTNCLVRAVAGVQLGLVGVSNLAVVVEADAVLVADLAHSQAVKQLVERIGPRASTHQGAKGGNAEELAELAARFVRWLNTNALPLWWALGADHERGGFHESLAEDGRPTDAPRRGRVQARQIFVYASAGAAGWRGPWRAASEHGLTYFRNRFRRDDGLFGSLVSADGEVLDKDATLYDQAFALLAMATMFHSDPKRVELQDSAAELLGRVRSTFTHDKGGFRESGAQPFQSNPLMHLLEASLAWAEAGGGEVWESLAREIVALARGRLIDPQTGALAEFYTPDWGPAEAPGDRSIWPGHQFEWAWLLDRWTRLTGDTDARAAALRLFEVGSAGVDASRAVAVDAVNDRLTITDRRARLWPQTERLKSAVALADGQTSERRTAMLGQAADAARGLWRYLESPTVGLWRDRMLPDGSFAEEAAPASSLYHIVGAVEALRRFDQTAPGRA